MTTTTASLDFLPRRVRLDIEDVYMRPGFGGHEVRLQLKLQAPWLPDDTPESVETLSLLARIDVSSGSSPRPLGQASLSCLVRRFPTSEQLCFIISDDQLLGLEVMRGEAALDFQLDLTAVLSDRRDPRPSWTATQVRHMFMPSRWLELLDQIGAEATIAVRVPSPLTDPVPHGARIAVGSASASQAAHRLREARQLLRDGSYEACVRTCRLVLDNLRELAPPASASHVNGIVPSSRNQSQRWSALFHDLYSLASAANHDDKVTHTFSWSRADAQGALAMTAALLARVPSG